MTDDKDDTVKASVYMPRKEYVDYKIDAAKTGSKISQYLLHLIRLGKKVLSYGGAFLDYDFQDFMKIVHGEEPDQDFIEREIRNLGAKMTRREFYERLKQMKQGIKEARRLLDLREDVVDELLDELEHRLEEDEA